MKQRFFLTMAIIGLLWGCIKKEDIAPIEPITHSNLVITQPTIWKAENNPHTINGYVTVKGTILTIEPGTIIKFGQGAKLTIEDLNASLMAVGTPEKPITFTSASASPAPGNWEYIAFKSGVINSQMAFCNVEFGGGNNSIGMVEIRDNAQVSINNCNIKKSANSAVQAADGNGFVNFTANTLESTTTHAMKILAANVNSIGTGNTFLAPSSYGILIGGSLSAHYQITTDITLSKQSLPYYLNNSITVKGGGKLTIEPGVVVKIGSGNNITIGYNGENGQLVAKGTLTDSIYLTSSSLSPQAGDWDYIRFQNGAINCEMEYCHVSYGGNSASLDMVTISDNTQISIKNSKFSHFKNNAAIGIRDEGPGFGAFENNVILASAGRHAMRIRANHIKGIGEGNLFITGPNNGVEISGNLSSSIYITSDATWKALNVPYYASEDLIVSQNSTLTLAPGTILKFASGKRIETGTSSNGQSKLIAIGTEDLPITFTSASASPQKGDWKGIIFNSGTMPGTELNHCIIEYAGSSYGNIEVYPCGTSNPAIQNSQINHSAKHGIYKRKVSGVNGDPMLYNNTFFNNTLGDIGQQ